MRKTTNQGASRDLKCVAEIRALLLSENGGKEVGGGAGRGEVDGGKEPTIDGRVIKRLQRYNRKVAMRNDFFHAGLFVFYFCCENSSSILVN